MKPKLNDSTNKETMSIGQLWEALDHFCHARTMDNTLYNGEYPLETRDHQLETLKTLVSEIEKFHSEFKTKGE